MFNSTDSSTLPPILTPPNSGTSTPTIITESKQELITTITTKGDKLISTETISRPIVARGTSQSKVKSTRVHGFQARTSAFDRENLKSQADPFRGFYTLFWILLFVGGLRTCIRTFQQTGSILGLEFGRLITKDAVILAISDAVLVGSTFICVPFVKLLNRGTIRYHGIGIVLQHTVQTTFLGIAVYWTFHRNWPWVQSGFLVLHALSTLMKVHSYCSTNGGLSEKARKYGILQKQLILKIKENGGSALVHEEARSAWLKGEKEKSLSNDKSAPPTSPKHEVKEFEPNLEILTPLATPSDSPPNLRRRRTVHNPVKELPQELEVEEELSLDVLTLLTWHPSPLINTIAIDLCDLKESLVSKGIKKVQFPENVNFYNYVDFMLVPTLVYELEYPRTQKIRPMYVIEKTLATLGTFSILYLITEHYILPISPSTQETSFFISVLDLSLPFIINYLLIFYIIFECICNVFAELTKFSDREFYQDWWNSTSFDEFSRRWNIPVHAFLLRHVYASTITNYKFSKFQATFATFLLSACVHELVMAVVTKKLRLYLFLMQMCQIPLVILGRLPFCRKYPAVGNAIFWVGLGTGFPLLAVAYLRF